ncbi:MAG: Rieske (2Fe-2S) protein [Magnetovibrionaceae bacterium]
MNETARQPLCALEDIPDGEARGFTVEDDGMKKQVFVVRQGPLVFGYLNVCPHLGTPLNFRPDDFLDTETGRIVCSTHMAEFRIEDGYCLSGPCKEDSLISFPVKVEDGLIQLA